ncbi:MBL fold metallo-hydrolase [Persicobacter sp. CCB-QB2]|uniref:MBL fold metallo-hydrolase n=1 Tax=Persicobacter sp. CCB-QB2 TaxID=1561025 RepID=UPI0006A9EFA9|nr:MBL fold metallo-hydrolase [Persicobacter sp. CCB-QB2]
MKIHAVDTGDFKLDGGAMFGVVPKSLWSKAIAPDENNMLPMTMRCMLIEEGDRKILVDTGIGNKQSEKFFSFYFLSGEGSLLGSLEKLGVKPEEITDVFFTHFHFDHAGGAIIHVGEEKQPAYQFPNAKHWTSKGHWDWATDNPNPRERASFLPENILPLKTLGQLHFVEDGHDLPFEIVFCDGHTEKQMLPKLKVGDRTVVFMADLLPTAAHVPQAWVVGYDTRPLLTMDEKQTFLQEAAEGNYLLFLEHDLEWEVCTVKMTEKGVRLNERMSLAEALEGVEMA